MKRFGKKTIFFIICGAVFILGLICTIGGVAAGGVDGLKQVAQDRDWVYAGPGERGVSAYPMEDFDSVQVTGEGDVWLVGRGFYQNASRLVSEDLLQATELDLMKKNQVLVIAGDQVMQPGINVRNKTLSIEFKREDMNGINIDTSNIGWAPTVLICCPQDPLEELNVSSEAAEVNCLGIAWKQANIQLNAGDVSMESVESFGLQLVNDSGDTEIQGKLTKTTSIRSESGSIMIDTPLPQAEYGLDLSSPFGYIQLVSPKGRWESGGDIEDEDGAAESICRQPGGPNTITGGTDSGEIEIRFGE